MRSPRLWCEGFAGLRRALQGGGGLEVQVLRGCTLFTDRFSSGFWERQASGLAVGAS